MTRNILVIGGTLFIGRELVRRLLARGDRVTILHRGRSPVPPEAKALVCDRNDTAAVRRSLAGRSFDWPTTMSMTGSGALRPSRSWRPPRPSARGWAAMSFCLKTKPLRPGFFLGGPV